MLKKLSYILTVITLICTMAFAAGCGSKNSDDKQAAPKASFRSIADIKQSGKLIIGVFSDKAPFGYIDKDGNYQGYDVYFAERLAKDLGVKAEYISLEPANRVEYAKTGKVDIVLANFTVTKERAEQVDFALPYMKVALGVVSPAKANITSIDQLKDKPLIVAKGTTAETYFAKHHPMAFAAGCGSKNSDDKQAAPKASFRSIADIKQSGKLIIGVFSDKAPFGYIDKDGNYQGYDVYFAERLAKDLGVKAEYISLEPANRVEYAKTGKVDIVLANFTVTKERAEQVDFALPYMKVALGVVSPAKANITSIDQLKDKPLIVAKGTTAETYFAKHHPEVKLLKFDQYTETFNALLDGRGAAFSTDNTEVLAWAMKNPDFKVGITSLGDLDTIAPAVQKGNKELLAYINDEIKKLGEENFFHKNYEATLAPVYGSAVDPDDLVVEGGEIKK